MVQLDPALSIFFSICKFVPGDMVRPIPAKLLPYFTISPKWHSGTCFLSSSSPSGIQWDLPPCYFFPKAIVGPTPAITSPYMQIVPGGTVRPISALFLPYFTISSLVAPNFFTTCKFVSGGTVRPIPCKPLPYCTISSLVAQWDLPPL